MKWTIILFSFLSFIIIQQVEKTSCQNNLFAKLSANPNLSTFLKLVSDNSQKLLGEISSTTTCPTKPCSTLFIPDNNAMKLLPANYNVTEFLNRHLRQITTPLSTKPVKCTTDLIISSFGKLELFDSSFVYQLESVHDYGSTFYMIKNGQKYFNHAQITSADNDATNGVYHIIDRPLYPLGINAKLMNYLLTKPNLSQTNSFWSKITQDSSSDLLSYFSETVRTTKTLFIPTNDAWKRVPDSVMTQLNNNLTYLTMVMASHFAPHYMVFVENLNQSSSSSSSSMTFNTSLVDDTFPYLSPVTVTLAKQSDSQFTLRLGSSTVNISANVDEFNIPLTSAVVHYITEPLGVIHYTKRDLLQTHASDFLAQCDTIPACSVALARPDLSVIAPSNAAMKFITNVATYNWTTHFVASTSWISSSSLSANSIAIDEIVLRYRREPDGDEYIDAQSLNGGFIPAKIEKSNLNGVDGKVIIIDRPLALNYFTLSSLLTFLTGYDKFLSKWNHSLFVLDKNVGELTVLVPTNDAMATFESTANNIFTNPTKLAKVLQRHVIVNTVNMFSSKTLPDYSYEAASANYVDSKEYIPFSIGSDKNTVTVTAAGKTTTFNLQTSGFRAVNGFVYPLTTVLFSTTD